MSKSSKKSDTKVEAAPPASMTKPLKKGKRDAEQDLDIQVSKKQKKDLIATVQKEKAAKKIPKKVETSSSESSDSEEEQKTKKTKKVTAKEPPSKLKDDSSSSSSSEDDSSSSSEDDSSSDEKTAPVKKVASVPKKAKADSTSSDDGSSSDEEPAPAKKQPAGVEKPKAESGSSEDETSEDETSEDETSSDEESAPVKKQPAASKNAKAASSSSEGESSSDEEPTPAKKKPTVGKKAKAAAKDSSSSEEDSDDEESDDEKPPTKKPKVSSTKTSKQETSSDESSEESDEEESEDEKVTPKKKDSDIEMVDAEQKSNAKQPKKPTSQGGSKTLFAGNLSYAVQRSDIENFFKEAGEVVDVRIASHEDGSAKGYGHVEFVSAEAAQKAMELNGKPLLGRDVRLDLANEMGNRTPRSSNPVSYGVGSQFRKLYVRGFDTSLGEDELKDAFRNHFSTCGEVGRISLPTDRESGVMRGMAYVDMKSGFDEALQLSGSEMGGGFLTVEEARPRDSDGSGSNDRPPRDNGGRFSNRRGRGAPGRGPPGRGPPGRGRGRFSNAGRGPSKPSLIASAQGKKTVFNDEE
ncbi:PREDICTED: nucleolin 2 isoform X3 [Camelina sativa]|uniref:Nucleolin 2 isoform X3 n=1 Tax=Camelina sativa TaxID=90675 RepID=A0ABM1QZ06_CAMSA|nr:PREDICTED: nucleolin 2 isoform X3 [Camelina sativa]